MDSRQNTFRSIVKLFTTGDKVLVAILIFLGITSLVAINKEQRPGDKCAVEVHGKRIHQLKLSENQNLSIDGARGKTVILIKDNKVRIIHSDCPEKICEKTGWISNIGEMIVCVPNKVVIILNGEKHDFFNVITQ